MAALVGVAMFVIAVVALHLLQPNYEPTHQLMSELALGPYGWAMIVAFGQIDSAAGCDDGSDFIAN